MRSATSPTSRRSRCSRSAAYRSSASPLAAARDDGLRHESGFVAVVAGSEAQTFEHLMLDFLAYLEFERGLSRNTLEAYRSDLLQFGRFLAARHADALMATGADVSDFLTDLAKGDTPQGGTGGNGRAPASAATLHRKAACLRSFY